MGEIEPKMAAEGPPPEKAPATEKTTYDAGGDASGGSTSSILKGAKAAADKERSMSLWEGIRLYPKAIAWSVLISTCIVMEGYDISLVTNFCEYPRLELSRWWRLRGGSCWYEREGMSVDWRAVDEEELTEADRFSCVRPVQPEVRRAAPRRDVAGLRPVAERPHQRRPPLSLLPRLFTRRPR